MSFKTSGRKNYPTNPAWSPRAAQTTLVPNPVSGSRMDSREMHGVNVSLTCNLGNNKTYCGSVAVWGKSCHRKRGDTQMRPRLQTLKIVISSEGTSTGWQLWIRICSLRHGVLMPQLSQPCRTAVCHSGVWLALSSHPTALALTAHCVKWHPCPWEDRAGTWKSNTTSGVLVPHQTC